MTIRVALVIPTMDRGGAEKQVCLLAANLPREEFEVRVFLLTRDGPRSAWLRRAGVPVEVIGKRFQADPRALVRLRRRLQEFHPAIAHSWLFAANSFGRAAARLAGVPHLVASERCVDLWKTPAHFWLDRRLARWTDAITTNSAAVREFYAAHGIDPALFRVIPNAAEPLRAAAVPKSEVCRRLGLPENRKLIFAVGRLWPQKRYRDLIWAAELLATLREDTTLVILGDGPQRGELLRHRDAVTRPEHVRFAGAREDVAELLSAADAFWIGSEYEGQSNAVIEAMQAGVPVVASDIPPNRDLVLPDRTGVLVELGDSAGFAGETNRLLESPQLAAQLTAAARRRIETEFSVEAMVAAHAELYRELCQEKATGAVLSTSANGP